jgi:putative tryptophan/tyrosine transport system substrate-binding protein
MIVGRRRFMVGLSAAIAGPLDAGAQQSERMRRIGILVGNNEADQDMQLRLDGFRKGLQSLGWSEGRNLRIDYRFGTTDQQVLAKELVELRPDVIFASSSTVVKALQRETSKIPIVFDGVSDPIGSGFVASLARPGGNLTGVLLYEEGIPSKWLAILKEIAPAITRVALLANPKTTAYEYFLRNIEGAAASQAVELIPSRVETAADIERVIETLSSLPNAGLIMPPDPTTAENRALIIGLTAERHLPAVYPNRFAVLAGGLISYGVDRVDGFRLAASYVDSILRGKKPADLPVQTPVKYETTINIKTAKALGLSIPASLLATADEVIE